MNVIDEIVAPDAAGVLVESHRPETDNFGFRIGIEVSEFAKAVDRNAGHFRGLLQRVFRDELCVILERDVGCIAGLRPSRRLHFKGIVRPQSIADIRLTAFENGVFVDKILVHTVCRDDVIGDGVQNREIGLRRENDLQVCKIEGAMLECRKHRNANMRRAEPAISHPAPEDRVHLCHVRAPQHESIGGFEVVVATHRLVHAERPHEAHSG